MKTLYSCTSEIKLKELNISHNQHIYIYTHTLDQHITENVFDLILAH